jgi:hemerythrin-like metal-binding protein
MAALPWKDEYNINVAVIDKQHRRLADLVSQLHQALRSDPSAAASRERLHELIGFARLHFATEEELMLKYEYPDYRAHLAEHKLLLAQLQTLAAAIDENSGVGFRSDADIADDWVSKHLLERDMELGRFLNDCGVF